VTVIAVLIVTAIEALLRRRLPLFLISISIVIALVVLIWLLVTNLRIALGALALIAAASIGIANLRTIIARR